MKHRILKDEAIEAVEGSINALHKSMANALAKLFWECQKAEAMALGEGDTYIADDAALCEMLESDEEEIIKTYLAPINEAVVTFYAKLGIDCLVRINDGGIVLEVSTTPEEPRHKTKKKGHLGKTVVVRK